MATLYPNARLSALPCELMRGCIFAENFVNETKVNVNKGVVTGSGETIDHGATLTGSAQIGFGSWHGYTTSTYLSVVVQFSRSAAATSKELLFSTGSSLTNGFEISVDADGIKANHNDGGTAPTTCEVDLSYADGETHTITYLVDLVSGSHSLYVDSLAVNTQTTTKSSIISATALLYFSSAIGGYFTGTIYKARVFNQLLTEAEHDLYHADTLTTFLDEPMASWRCDSICNDTDGDTILDRSVNHNNLYKGDRSTSSYFPTFDTDKYLFDYVDDYVSNFPTLPAAYTLSAVTSTPQEPYPEVRQENDTTFKTLIAASGDFWGYMHNMVLVNKALTQIELYHLEYMQQYWQWRGRAWGAYNRLNTEGVCVLSMFLDADRDVYRDYSGNGRGGIADGVTRGDDDGCTFAATGGITFPHEAAQNTTEGTIVILGDFSGAHANETWIDKGENYKLRCTSGGNVIFSIDTESTYMKGGASWGTHEHLAVTFKDGFTSQFFIDGVYASDGLASVSVDDTATEDLVIGNNNAFGDNSERALQQVAIFNKVLTPQEIKALYESAKYIRENPMEAGSRIRVRQVFTAAAVDEDVDPGGPFQLLEIDINFNTAPTTSEDITITLVNSNSDVIAAITYDPSTSAATSHRWVFDERLDDGTTIAIDYTNTDGRTITTNTIYQSDDSVV